MKRKRSLLLALCLLLAVFAGCGTAVDLITGEPHDFGGGSELPPYSASFWKMER